MTKFIIILLSAVFINNYVLSRFLGICPFLGVSKKLNQAAGMSAAVIFVMLMATAVTCTLFKRICSTRTVSAIFRQSYSSL